VRGAAEAVIACCKLKALSEFSDSSIVGIRVIKHKVSKLALCYTKDVNYIANNFSYSLACIGTCKLRQRDRQVPNSAISVSKVSYYSKEAAFTAFCCLAVEAYIDLTNSRRQHLNNLRLYVAI
jgi:hypothetical protein